MLIFRCNKKKGQVSKLSETIKQPSKKIKRKIFTGLGLLVLLALTLFFLFSGDNVQILKELFKDNVTKEEVQDHLSELGWRGWVGFGGLSMLQVILTFIPAEPVQVMAGISFGIWKGGLICLCGVFVGNTVLYVLYKIFGQRLTEYFSTNAEFDFDYARKSKRVAFVIFILYFLPAIPYGLICLFAASLNTRYPKYIFLTTLGAIPSILIGVGLGHLAMAASWILSAVIFAVLIVAIIVLWRKKSQVFAAINQYMKNRNQKDSRPRKPDRVLVALAAFYTVLAFDTKIKLRLKNSVGEIEKPSIVLCNHGSFVDFVYAGRILRKYRPQFITARLYFYHNLLRGILHRAGCIPKSMFASDLENAKNVLSVISDGGVLSMMPEARLSTIGKFEGIQDTTYRFIQRMGVPVYTVCLRGDYLCDPKWGSGVRKGSLVEGEFKQLLTKDEVKTLSLEELKKRIDGALYYDEFAWLETHPEIHYKSKKLAEGLENILFRCPNCGAVCSLTTKGHTIRCTACGQTHVLNDRYGFTENKPFDNFATWYEWQSEELKKEILGNPDYQLKSKVELRHGSKKGDALTRHAGEGECILDRTGLTYRGTEDGEQIEKRFPMANIYRILFGAGQNFEIYEGKEIWFFVPEDKRSSVIWYVASAILKQETEEKVS